MSGEYKLGDIVEVNVFGSKIDGTVIGIPQVGNVYPHCFLIGWRSSEKAGAEKIMGAWKIASGSQFLASTELHVDTFATALTDPFTNGFWINKTSLALKEKMRQAHLSSAGLSCKGCQNFYPYAEANQPDGTLTCWSCKQYPFYK